MITIKRSKVSDQSSCGESRILQSQIFSGSGCRKSGVGWYVLIRWWVMGVVVLISSHSFGAIINVPGDFATIQGAINAAVNGDEIIVAPGTYNEVINFLGKAIHLRSASGIPADTIIDGEGLNESVVRCISGEGVGTILEGITITGGVGNDELHGATIGGGMINDGSSPTVSNCIFIGNFAENGGGMFNSNGSPRITNCLFIANKATDGGGIFNDNCSPLVTNCSFSGNKSTEGAGAGMFNFKNSNVTLTNCILWGNSPDEMFNDNLSTILVSFSNIRGGLLPGTVDGGGNIDANPLFVDADGMDNIPGTMDDDFRLNSGSPATDAGDNSASGLAGIIIDLDGLPRFFDDDGVNDTGNGVAPIVDMGVFERQTSTIFASITFDLPTEVIAAGEPNIMATGNLDTPGGLPEDMNPGFTTTDVVAVIPGNDLTINGTIQVFLNQGVSAGGGWLGLIPNAVIEVGLNPTGVAIGLFNDDLFHDLAVTNANDGNVMIFINTGNGDGTFVSPPDIVNLNPGESPQAIAAGDFTGDGLTDLAVVNIVSNGADNLVILENQPGMPNIFALGQLIPVGDGPRDVDPADKDNDKDLDLLVTNSGSGTVIVFDFDAGTGLFSQLATLPVGPNPVDSAIGDLSGNGFPDFVTANSDGTLSVIANMGGFQFDSAMGIPVGVSPRAVDMGDFDGDSDLDLIVAAIDSGLGPGVQVLENLTLGGGEISFSIPLAFSVDADPNFVVTADMDGNSIFDVITVNSDTGVTGGSVTVLLSTLDCPADIIPEGGGNGTVNIDDLVAVLSAFGLCPPPEEDPCAADIAPAGISPGNGVVNIDDLVMVLGAFGECPTPYPYLPFSSSYMLGEHPQGYALASLALLALLITGQGLTSLHRK